MGNPFPCVGHDQAIDVFRAAFAKGRPPSAFLILGPQGVGKKTYAYHCAWHVLSQHCLESLRPSLAHQMRSRTQDGFFVCEGSTVESAQAIRAYLKRSLTYAHGWRVIVVPRIDDMTSQALASLLKSVEEPPTRTIFLLTARTLGALSAPLISRCQRVYLRPLLKDTFEQSVKGLFDEVEKTLTPSVLSHVYQLSRGCLGRARDIIALDQESNHERYRTLFLKGLLGSAHPEYVSPFHMDQQDFWGGCDISWLYENFESWICDLLIRKVLGEPLSSGEVAVVQRLSPEGWSRFLMDLKDVVSEANVYHLSPFQVAPHFFRTEPYRSF